MTQDDTNNHQHVMIDSKLLEILVCPLTKGTLTYDKEKNELISEKAKLAFIRPPYKWCLLCLFD